MNKQIDNSKQVILISNTGELTATHLRKGKPGVDITKLGKADIHRASDIVWTGSTQSWAVLMLEGPENGNWVTSELWDKYVNTQVPEGTTIECDGLLTNKTYEEAVALETHFLNNYRIKTQNG